jgi:diguanylate cyclase (GGDEF)-like protein
LENLFEAVIFEGDNLKIQSKNPKIDENFFYEVIKPLGCGKVVVDNEEFWVLKKDNVYIVDKFECLNDLIKNYEKKAIYDALTECYNKKESEEFIKKFLYNYLRYKKSPFSIMMIDIDFFKKINDTYGHLAGDFILKNVADRVKGVIRKSDICGRFGGEEFVVILPNTKISGAMKLANRIKESIEKEEFEFNGKKINLTVSIGITSAGINDSYESLISRADEALYEAKNKGRNRIEYR